MPSQSHSFAQPRKQQLPEVDSPLPAGFFKRLHDRTMGRGEKRLAAAVLEDAVHMFQKHRGAKDFHRSVLYWEAESWFSSRERKSLFSFENVCSILGLRSTDIRRLLLRWTERRKDGLRPPEWSLPRSGNPGVQLAAAGSAGIFPVVVPPVDAGHDGQGLPPHAGHSRPARGGPE